MHRGRSPLQPTKRAGRSRQISHAALRSLYLTTEAGRVAMQFSGLRLAGAAS